MGFKEIIHQETARPCAILKHNRTQRFNMSDYRAPKLDKCVWPLIGLGMRGPGAVQRMSHIEGVEIKALCDLRPAQVDKALKLLEGTSHKPW